MRRTSNPSIFRRMARCLRNAANTFRDALVEAMGTAMAQAKKAHPGSAVMSAQEARVSKVGETVIGYTAHAYEPVLEHHIFDPVLIEEQWREGFLRHRGILKEYSSAFVEVLDVELQGEFRLPLNDPELMTLEADFAVGLEGGILIVSNRGANRLLVKEVVGEEFRKEIDREVGPGETARFDIAGQPPGDAVLVVEWTRKADILFPRARAWVRHGSSEEKFYGSPA